MVGLTSTVKPFLERVERGIELWMNHEHDLTGDVDVDVSVSNLQSSDELVEQLEAAEEPLSGFDRIEVISQLSRTGYSTEEIAEILDEYVPADDGGE
jgi:transcriptional regulator of NAD metabolism